MSRLVAAAFVPVGMLGMTSAHAQAAPGNPNSYSVTTSYTYRSDGGYAGKVNTATTSPDQSSLCAVTSYGYDSYGNKNSVNVANCAGAPATASFASRQDSSVYGALPSQAITVGSGSTSVAVSAGIFPTSIVNGANQTETRQYDPRYGVATDVVDIDQRETRTQIDDFGRVVRETHPDGTGEARAYCVLASSGLDASSNSAGCVTPAAGEAPADATAYVQKQPLGTTGQPMGAFVRSYTDRLGRLVRTVTQSFDGAGQPGARASALVVTDTVYNPVGTQALATSPYFLASGSSTTTGSNDAGVTMRLYDATGRVVTTYVADPRGHAGNWTFGGGGFGYGQYGSRQARRTTVAYSGAVSLDVDDLGNGRSVEHDPLGEVVRVTDANGGQLARSYDAFGHLLSTRDALQNVVSLAYDYRGHKIRMSDPDKGVWNYGYDALGQLVSQQSPNERNWGTSTTMTYDALGRMTTQSARENVATWTYDACSSGVGRLCQVDNSNGLHRTFAYDAAGRIVGKRTFSSAVSLPTAFGYDTTTGRLSNETYPTGLSVSYAYTANGFVQAMNLATAATVNPLPSTVGGTPGASVVLAKGSALWTAAVVNADGVAEQQVYGNGVTSTMTLDGATGRVTDLNAGPSNSVVSQHYDYDSLSNLTSRVDNIGDGSTGAVSETFTYGDHLNRLTGYAVSGTQLPGYSRSVSLQYNALGMLLSKSDVGDYAYNAAGGTLPHAVQRVDGSLTTLYGYDANGNVTSSSSGKYSSIAYTSFDLPDASGGIKTSTSNPAYAWLYDESHERVRETRTAPSASGAGQDVRTTWYDHMDGPGSLNFEYEVDTPASNTPSTPLVSESRHFLSVGGVAVGVLVSEGSLSVSATVPPSIASLTLRKVEYWHRDHLGSLVATTNQVGAVTARYAYDPFGKRRYPDGAYDANGQVVADWSSTVDHGTARGFTGHEHLDDVGLVNMNGRIYDPSLGVFLQADSAMTDADNLQDYNRFGYCMNDPLNCTDPSGHSWLSKEWHKIIHNKLIRTVAIIVAAYYTGGAALDAFASDAAATAGFAAESAAVEAGADASLVSAAGSMASSVAYASASSSILGGAIAGATSGLTAGLLSSDFNLKAGLRGALAGGVMGGFGAWQTTEWSSSDPSVLTVGDQQTKVVHWDQVFEKSLTQSAARGAISRLEGGRFSSGFDMELIESLSTEVYKAYVPWPPKLVNDNGDAHWKDAGEMAYRDFNNFGGNNTVPPGFLDEGGTGSRFLDTWVPGMDSISRLHDVWANSTMGFPCESDHCWSMMLPAAVVVYGQMLKYAKP